jgi:pyruvate formate lyase activating enzyme
MKNGVHVFDRSKCVACGKCEKLCSAKANKLFGGKATAKELLPQLLLDKPFFDKTGGGITVSGGEPLLQADFLAELLPLLKKQGVGTAIDTSLAVSAQQLEKVIPHADLFLCDIKAMDPQLHKQLTGVTNERILKNIALLAGKGADVLIRIPVAMGLNGTEENIRATARFMKENGLRRIELLKLHRLSDHKYSALDLQNTHPDVPETTDADIEAFYQIFEEYLGDSMIRGI